MLVAVEVLHLRKIFDEFPITLCVDSRFLHPLSISSLVYYNHSSSSIPTWQTLVSGQTSRIAESWGLEGFLEW